MIAQAIHRLSRRAIKLYRFELRGFADTLLESELFGHEAGAFFRRACQKTRAFEIADNGTLFLDEVMNANRSCNRNCCALSKLAVFPRRRREKVEVYVRLVAATKPNAAQSTADGTFRPTCL